MKFRINLWSRKLHRWGAIAFCIPLVLVISTGLLLQLKKQWAWVQPPTQTGSDTLPQLSWDRILEISMAAEPMECRSWDDIDRLDVRPDKGVVKVRAKNHWELQLDLATGEVLSSTYRRSDLIESLHDGSWFSEVVKMWVFLPNGIVLLCLWITGLYLWWLPIGAKRKKRKRLANPEEKSPSFGEGRTRSGRGGLS